MAAAESRIPQPVPTEADGADLIAGLAITVCCIALIAVVIIDLASIKASFALLSQNINTIRAG